MLCEGLEIEIPDSEAENTTRNSDFLRHEGDIVIEGIPALHEVRFMCMFISLGRILLQGSVSVNLFDPMPHYMDLWKVEVGS
jgi:hypothetical protein